MAIYLNQAAFVKGGQPFPAFSTATGSGNVGPNPVPGPGQNNFDLALMKITTVGGLREDATLQFRADFYNAFNHPQFSNPTGLDVSSAGFGRITSLSVNPRLVQFGLNTRF